ncbi:GPI ethanolamine phosphate transferase 1-like isoform X2 [Anopheles albimanus]|uniref:GPI ethanolamine phosphate transferase 1-like isoform X2 n=1 Tax=Anopheles albimanus TaxID=7167 RepID=UPI00163EB7FF|nr:GPI ethanolamine phosphate transferase 1-like isoform X2 [Anopheles albimanus]
MKLFLLAIAIHVVFLLSIFYIHFQSPIIQGLSVGRESDRPPADRLVLFVGDGLRAESFLKHNLSRTKYLRKILLTQGVFGISNTRVPTESRPGHAALLGGVHEDPSAVFKGWKENPVEFDSVLNRSSTSWCWGSPDIVNMFSRGATDGRVHTDVYAAHDELFTQSANTSLLDIWVFDRVRRFLSATPTGRDVLARKKVIFFLHLLGLDTAGHVYKPNSLLFAENLIIVDKGIESTVALIERSTGYDGRTAYIFTSDHGMTDKGSHGSGDTFETETPFVAWGAGIGHWNRTTLKSTDESNFLQLDGHDIPVAEFSQADIAPFISAVLGIAVPKNNLGILPRQLLNVSEEYATWAMWNNAEQLLRQYYYWQKAAEQKMFQSFATPKQENFKVMIENIVGQIEDLTDDGKYVQAQKMCDTLMSLTLEAIRYFQTYYQSELLFALTMMMLGWILMLTRQTFAVASKNNHESPPNKTCRTTGYALSGLVGFLVLILNIAQKTPSLAIFYFLVPVAVWGYIVIQWREYKSLFTLQCIFYGLGFVVFAEALVFSIMEPRLLGVLLFVHCCVVTVGMKNVENGEINMVRSVRRRWICGSLLLIAFPLIPKVGRIDSNVYLLIISIIVWMVANMAIIRNLTLPQFVTRASIMVHLLNAVNMLYIVYVIESNLSIPLRNRALCWIFSVLGLLMPLFTRSTIADRTLGLISGLSIPYTMLSLSYEPLFLLSFCLTLYGWLEAECLITHGTLMFYSTRFNSSQTHTLSIGVQQTRQTWAFILLLLTSFFGTGNLATVSSFDPNWVRCFVATFSPFTMMALIILKLLIPVVLVVCTLRAIVIVTSVPKNKLFTLTLILCDVMCLNFFFLVRNEGSWLDIGTSISHFVIMQCTTIVIMMLYEFSRLITEWSFVDANTQPEGLPVSNKIMRRRSV